MGFIDNLLNAIRNKYLNATGAERDLLTLIKDKDITQAQTLMQNRDTEVLQAIQEYNPELHRIMRKADKMRKGQEPYRTEKLPRARQKYINEVELFFLLGNPIRWKKVNNEGSDEAFEAYNQFLQDTRFNVSMRKAKRIAGAETECAKLYHIYRDENFQPQVKVVVICKSKGYTLRPLFDLYENLIAFGYGGTTLKRGHQLSSISIFKHLIRSTDANEDLLIGRLLQLPIQPEKSMLSTTDRIKRGEASTPA